MSCYGLLALRHAAAPLVCILVCVSVEFCTAARPNAIQSNATASKPTRTVETEQSTRTEMPTTKQVAECRHFESSCENCSRLMHCAWCFSEKKCLAKELRQFVGKCEEDDWYYGDCDKPEKEAVLVYVLLGCALFLLVIVIMLVLYIFFCKMPKNKEYEPLSTKEKRKKRKRTPLMSKKVKPSASRTDELKKKYQLDG